MKTYEQWQGWFIENIERDYHSKIFFKDEKSEVEEDYKALQRIFGKLTV